jgi:hypothetical protein
MLLQQEEKDFESGQMIILKTIRADATANVPVFPWKGNALTRLPLG